MARNEITSDNDMIIYSSSENVVVEISDAITFWSSLIGKPSDSKPLVDFLNSLLEGKQDLIYFIVDTEADKESIKVKKTGSVVFVKETQKLYIYYAETPEWILINQDLSVFYNKDEVDSLLALKANISDVYSKIEADERFATILDLDAHKNNKNNPHEVTKSQVGLSNVENLAPLDMPISNATQQALDGKQNTITGAVSNVTDTNLTPNKVVVTNAQGKLATDDIDISGLEMLEGLTGNVQDQLDGKEDKFNKNTAFNKNFTTNLSNIKMDGVRSLGTSNEVPRADHVHPSDTSKVDANAPISSGTYTKISYDSKGLVTGGSNLQASDIPVLTQYELKVNKVNEITDSTIEYPTTKAVKNALAPKADKTYVDASIAEFSAEINNKENKFDKNTAFNKNFATDKQEFQMDGEAFAGTSNNVPRADHVHPTDTSREAVANKTDSYSYNSPTLYPSTRALYHGLRTRLKPENVIGGSRINVIVDGEKIIINSYGGTTTTMWGGIIGDIQDQTDLMAKLSEKADTTDIHDGTLTIQVNGTDLATFTANDEDDVVANIVVPDSATWGNITGTLSDQTDLQGALDNKVDKTTTADRVYGTDANGDQTTYAVDSFGQVDDVTVGGTSVVTNKVAVLGSMAGETASDYSTTTVANTLYAAKSLESTVSGIEAKIPSEATAQNQLADKDFVNSSIATETANFIGTFDNESSLEAYTGTVTNNDYAFVINSVVTDNGNDWATFADLDAYSKTHLTNFDYAWVVNGTAFDLYRFDIVEQEWVSRATAIAKDSVSLNTAYNRYKAVVSGSTVTWTYEYTLNNSSFTAQQWAAINSGITSSGVAQISTNETSIGNLSTLTTTAKTDLVSAINELDSGKQDELPSQTGQSGKFLTTNGTAISWGDAPVTDVQINSTSILSSGVANIPYGTNAVAGLAKAGSGLASMAGGTFYIYPATDAAIQAKTNTANPIVPSNLEKAVMEGLGNYSGTAWTNTYKSNARNTIGATQAVFVDWSD